MKRLIETITETSEGKNLSADIFQTETGFAVICNINGTTVTRKDFVSDERMTPTLAETYARDWISGVSTLKG